MMSSDLILSLMSLRKSLVAGLSMLQCLMIFLIIFFSGAKLASLMFHPLISRRLKRTGGWEVVFECSIVKREVSREQCNCLISVMTYQLHLLPDLVERSIFAILRTEKNQLALPSVFSPIVFLLLCCCRVTPAQSRVAFQKWKSCVLHGGE